MDNKVNKQYEDEFKLVIRPSFVAKLSLEQQKIVNKLKKELDDERAKTEKLSQELQELKMKLEQFSTSSENNVSLIHNDDDNTIIIQDDKTLMHDEKTNTDIIDETQNSELIFITDNNSNENNDEKPSLESNDGSENHVENNNNENSTINNDNNERIVINNDDNESNIIDNDNNEINVINNDNNDNNIINNDDNIENIELDDISSIKKRYEELKEMYSSLKSEHSAIESSYEELKRENKQLLENIHSLRKLNDELHEKHTQKDTEINRLRFFNELFIQNNIQITEKKSKKSKSLSCKKKEASFLQSSPQKNHQENNNRRSVSPHQKSPSSHRSIKSFFFSNKKKESHESYPQSDTDFIRKKRKPVDFGEISKQARQSLIIDRNNNSEQHNDNEQKNFGSLFGVKRGKCEVSGCDCPYYKKSPHLQGHICSHCSHFPIHHAEIDVDDDDDDLENQVKNGLINHDNDDDDDNNNPVDYDGFTTEDEGNTSPTFKTTPVKKKDLSKEVITTPSIPLGSFDEGWLIDYNDFEFIDLLGKGNSSTVYYGTHKGNDVAIKVLRFETHKNDIEDFKKEMQIMSDLRSPYIVHFHGATLTPRFCIALEYCPKGSLFHFLQDKNNHIDWKLAIQWFYQIVRGINTLHLWKPQVVHRDLKTLNLLIDINNKIKVCDFGLSRFVSNDHDPSTLLKMRGTLAYVAPEIYFGKLFSSKSDVYSIGIILWEIIYRLINGKHTRPYAEYKFIRHDFQIIIQASTKGLRPTMPEMSPQIIKDIFNLCVSEDPDKRPSCMELLEMLDNVKKEYEDNKEEWDSLVYKEEEKEEEEEI